MSHEYVLKPFTSEIRLNIDYARELNEQQFAAVTALPGPALVIAGAGSGKTRTLTYRVAYLLEQGIPPERILLLTFTNKAAAEMMRRVSDLLGQELRALWGGTFHSIGARDSAHARRRARLSARFHHSRPRRRAGFDQSLRDGCQNRNQRHPFSQARRAERNLFARRQHA